MKGQRILMGALVLALSLVLAVGLSQAEGPETPKSAVGTGEAGAAAVVDNMIPIQGRLTDASGNPINGVRTITFSLYDVSSGGTALCSDTGSVQVLNGLFNTEMDNCSAADINGRQLYLGVKVGLDPEMTPRQAIYPVPYAWSLRPGAIIGGSGAGPGILSLRDASDEETIWLDGGYGDIILGGTGEDGDLRIRHQSGVTETARLSGGDAKLTVGAAGVPGQIEVRNTWGFRAFWVEGNTGDVKQDQSADGLVKAGAYVNCAGTSSFTDRYFNNVAASVTIGTADSNTGQCNIDFNFDLSDRYWVATAVQADAARGVTCTKGTVLPDDELHCFRWDSGGAGANGAIMVLVY